MLGRDRSRLRARIRLVLASASLLCAAMLMAQGETGANPAAGGAGSTGESRVLDKKMAAATTVASAEDLRTAYFMSVSAVVVSSLNLLAVIGLYFRRVKLPPTPAPYDDSRLSDEISRLRGEVERFSRQLAALDRQQVPLAPTPQETRPARSPERALQFVGSQASVSGGVSGLLEDYQRSRPARASWKEFEARNSSERFECINVRDRLSRHEEPPRFETSTSGAYLAVPTGGGKYSVFPFFSANPWQFYHDGAMSEVYDFPSATGSGQLDVLQPAVFTRRDSQWNLQNRGRLGQ